ncbi:PAS domain-containing sensor histidine kinase [Streptomyces yaanensis]|uniref:PAS domain-containing sensor histidine kinase n=1 Tax=Streptomyces yaanensis TaxID=1142239 RepID=A0ABV7SPW6_9ACTN|nr:ATP-binding protein [Streptomyces sp. CGMCC 4.7035]WNB97197.1 ATP-binding protein [Streptomyces sp. CGMCC 4.7035]
MPDEGADLIHALLDQIPVSFWMSRGRDGGYEIVLWNAAASRIYGYTKQEAIGSSFLDLFVDEPQKDQAREDADRIIAGVPLVVPAVNCIAVDRDRHGNPVALLTNAFRVEFEGESFQAELAVDLTPSRFLQHTDAYYRAKREGPDHAPLRTLEAFLDHITELNSRQLALWGRTFAHEIRSELVPLRQALRQLAEDNPSLSGTDEFRDIERSVGSLRLLSDNFLSFQAGFQPDLRAGNPQAFARPGGFDLLDTVRAVTDEFAYAATQLGTDIALVLPDDPGRLNRTRLLGTREAFTNTMRNVLSNSVKHYDRSLTHGDGRITVTLARDKSFAGIAVRNPGQMPQSQIDHGFEPFYKDAQNPSEGMHLGLSIAHQWTKEVGGRISIANQADQVLVSILWPCDAHGDA